MPVFEFDANSCNVSLPRSDQNYGKTMTTAKNIAISNFYIVLTLDLICSLPRAGLLAGLELELIKRGKRDKEK